MVRDTVSTNSDEQEDRLPKFFTGAADAKDDNIIQAVVSAAHRLQLHPPGLYKVPADQRKANPDAYTPFLFSFGPYHAQFLANSSFLFSFGPYHAQFLANSSLEDGAYLKQMTTEVLLSSEQLESLAHHIEDFYEAQILAQYMQHRPAVDMCCAGRLALLLAMDSITIVAASISRELQMHKLTPLIYPVARLVLSDAMLLENQIPVFLLEFALQSILEGMDRLNLNLSLCLQDIIRWYCIRANPFPDWTVEHLPAVLEETAKVEPLLSFLYNHINQHLTHKVSEPYSSVDLMINHYKQEKADYVIYIDPSSPPASRLARCGVRFQVSRMLPYHVSFDRRKYVLFLPKITVSDTGVRVIHNLLAYEATVRLPEQYAFVSYVHLMDCLIDTADDVHILTDAGIICNKLGSHEELASM